MSITHSPAITEPPPVIVYTDRTAVLDGENHRYLLKRTWDESLPVVCFVMLNPSEADHELDDPTIRRCVRFAWRWGYGGIVVANLCSYRTPHPRDLRPLDRETAVGLFNDRYITQAVAEAKLTVVAWGNDGRLWGRDLEVLEIVRAHTTPMCFGVTGKGMPIHPSARARHRIPDDVRLRPYDAR